ncbi:MULTISPECIES: hypothetical protein [unclassified Streptomyces]|uniref:hypothetical protein n=2 Tax=Streptomyces TaxID=1883 RepID=UPI0035D5D7EE
MEVGDIQGGAEPEYTVSESTVDGGYWMNSNSVRALNGDDASLLWAHAVKRSGDSGDVGATRGLKVVDGRIIASYVVRGNSAQVPPNQPANTVQIRDGRTGELPHEAKAGGFAALANRFTGPEGLVEGSLASLRSYAADGVDRTPRALAEVRGGSFATGPDGARVLVRSGTRFVNLYDSRC